MFGLGFGSGDKLEIKETENIDIVLVDKLSVQEKDHFNRNFDQKILNYNRTLITKKINRKNVDTTLYLPVKNNLELIINNSSAYITSSDYGRYKNLKITSLNSNITFDNNYAHNLKLESNNSLIKFQDTIYSKLELKVENYTDVVFNNSFIFKLKLDVLKGKQASSIHSKENAFINNLDLYVEDMSDIELNVINQIYRVSKIRDNNITIYGNHCCTMRTNASRTGLDLEKIKDIELIKKYNYIKKANEEETSESIINSRLNGSIEFPIQYSYLKDLLSHKEGLMLHTKKDFVSELQKDYKKILDDMKEDTELKRNALKLYQEAQEEGLKELMNVMSLEYPTDAILPENRNTLKKALKRFLLMDRELNDLQARNLYKLCVLFDLQDNNTGEEVNF